ncbi:lanthionine synthetase C family protein [Kitasatospora atroaurantiaca]|uniref:lanthionine synthetase C family protein n=1 Tax=Kitasatospora atroaurantiaca TaxID=285545 RepID=UPI001BAB4408|nr:lanthionine synthetase C family protein [Kitasatospora atroaurantiaca]
MRQCTPPDPHRGKLFKLTGIGAHLLRHHRDAELLRDVLAYLVRLTDPLPNGLPGWWTHLAPAGYRSPEYLGGHGNLGLAHGISGPLALLSLATRQGVTVLGQPVAIRRALAWLDAWRQDGPNGPWWPEVVTRPDEASRRTRQREPLRPSWCYGTLGLARAQQLAALVLADTARKQLAEAAVLGCLSDPVQLGRVTDGGLCHGTAGLYQSMWRIAQDSTGPAFAGHRSRWRRSCRRRARSWWACSTGPPAPAWPATPPAPTRRCPAGTPACSSTDRRGKCRDDNFQNGLKHLPIRWRRDG